MEARINDFTIRIATVNGTGSQSANNILFKSLFRMGIGVCAKNLFPSNIQGLPTWFQIRMSPKGHQCRLGKEDVAVLMNPQSAAEDIGSRDPGTTVFFNSDRITIQPDQVKEGMILYPLPVETLSQQIAQPKLKTLLKNLFYVGALASIYGIDVNVVDGVIRDTFKRKQKAVEANLQAFKIGYDYAQANFKKQDNLELKAGNLNEGKIVLDGNSATALGAVYGGCTLLAWYPITPSSSGAETMTTYLKNYRTDSNGRAKYAVVQTEDELASAGMVVGGGWAGARSMTYTSGPGISLMNEFIGLAYYTETPGVFVDVERVGPSTGLPTRTQQSDVSICAWASHGDTRHIILFPSSLTDCFEMTQEAFNLADRFQTPVFVVTDLDIGMNIWVDDEFKYKKPKYDRGKILDDAALEKVESFARYKDVDGDGIPYRTLPGTANPKGAYFTRGSGHNDHAGYSEKPGDFSSTLDRLLKKWETAKKWVPKPVMAGDPKAKFGVIAYGSSHHAVAEALEQIETPIRYCRVSAYPFTKEIEQFLDGCETVAIVEQNRDGQLQQLLEVDIRGHQDKIHSIRYYGGFPLSSNFVETEIRKLLG